MWPWVLGSAALGGLQAYQQSGGDLGKTLGGAAIGGGLGALVPGVGRLAGTALAGTGLLTPLAGGLTKAATAGRQALGLVGPTQAVSAGQLARLAGTGAAGLAGMAIPGVAASLAGSTGKAASAAIPPVVGAGTTIAQMQQPSTQQLQQQLDQTQALSSLQSQLNRPISLADVTTGIGATARTAEGLEAQLRRGENIKDALAYMPIYEQVKKNELDRQLAAAQVRQNITTAADMLQSGYRTSQQIGANAAAQLGSALSAQYQYS